MLRQIAAISLTNLKTLPSRFGASSVVIVGVAGVVFVMTALLAMANGLKETLRSTGEDDRVLILGKGSHSEINGSITRDQFGVIALGQVAMQMREITRIADRNQFLLRREQAETDRVDLAFLDQLQIKFLGFLAVGMLRLAVDFF